MTSSPEPLQPRLRESTFIVLRRHHVAEDELEVEIPKGGVGCIIKGHRIRVHVDNQRADFNVRGGRWGAARADFPSTGAFLAAFEEQLHRALEAGAGRR